MAVPTVLSLSAIVSNGSMRGGGAYFMISRSLGPELGGAIGILFYLAYAIGASFYVIGFSTEVQTTFSPFFQCICQTALDKDNACPAGYCKEGALFVGTVEWTVAAIGTCALLLTLAISLKGAGFFAKFNVIFFCIHQGATLWGIISFFVPRTEIDPHGATIYLNSTTHEPFPAGKTVFLSPYSTDWGGDNFQRMKDNWAPAWEQSGQCIDTATNEASMCNFRLMFSVIFPMATGIMEGANLSGDLKDPAHSIPKGTLFALLQSFIIYMLLVICFAGAFKREVLRNDVHFHPHGGQFDSVWLPARTPHRGASYVR